jgi:hypothetical protein
MSKVKVVINRCFGGFSLSKEAMEYLAERGNVEAQEVLKDRGIFGGYLYDTPRHDPGLVETVEHLGDKASGTCAQLEVEVIEGNKYIIDEYDGAESVVTPKDINWITVS